MHLSAPTKFLLLLVFLGVAGHFLCSPNVPISKREVELELQSGQYDESIGGQSTEMQKYAEYEKQYLESLKDAPVVVDYVDGDPETYSEAELDSYEAQRMVERRKDLILELNDGESPELSAAEEEIVSQLLKEEGLQSIYDQ